MAEKSALQNLQEELFAKREHASKTLKKTAVAQFANDYKEFISENKTEREVVARIIKDAEAAGFQNLRSITEVKAGGTYYVEEAGKNVALIRFAGLKELRCVASHVDSPCLHLKPYPITESQKLAILKTHYYGGIKKYQWVNIPLALHGVAFTATGKRIDIVIGENEEDPVFAVPDLLPHLSKDQMEKTPKKMIEAEHLNPIIGNVPVEAEEKEIMMRVKLAVVKHLHDTYGLREQDLVGAELMLVPAGNARYVGFDKSLISAYGHDDRCCSYANLRAILDGTGKDYTQIAVFYDKEEIGSAGKTGAQNLFLSRLLEDLIDLSSSDVRLSHVWQRLRVLSADVTAAIDPNFPDVHDSTNSTFIGHGVAVEKYGGGGGGKYSTNDADAEFTSALIRMFDAQGVPWQAGELGKQDIGGGGTIAMYLAKQGADVIDCGAPVLGMHAPYELLSTYDLYSMYNAYTAFFSTKL